MQSDGGEMFPGKKGMDGSEECSWVVVHDAWRDQYQLPAAFAEAGLLESFVTDWYTPADRSLWATGLRSPLGRLTLGLRTRFSPLVPSIMVADQKWRFLAGLLHRKLFRLPFDDIVEGEKGGMRAARIANNTGSHLLAASYSAAAAFEALRPNLIRLLFQVHPQPRFLRHLYERQMAMDPDYSELFREPEFSANEASLATWEREASLADHILCASSFSKRSLIWSGISEDRISVVPYGVDTMRFQPASHTHSGAFKVLFVGQRVARKGLRTLLRVWKKIKPKDAELIVAGGHQADEGVFGDFRGNFTDVPRMSADALVCLYQNADVFVLPSLAEGFGHVYLEALACGTPILCTANTGAADLVNEGVNGWVIPSGCADALESRLVWILEHRNDVRAMRSAARSSVEHYTWARFRRSVRQLARERSGSAEAQFGTLEQSQAYSGSQLAGGTR